MIIFSAALVFLIRSLSLGNRLKRGSTAEEKSELDHKVRDVVKATLAHITARGATAIREQSVKFDNWNREDYRLSAAEIQDCVDSLSAQDLKDIEFAQTQVRNFAQIRQRGDQRLCHSEGRRRSACAQPHG